MKKEYRQKGKKTNVDLQNLKEDAAVICQGFAAFCSYIIQNQVKLSSKTGNIGKKDCFAINMLLDGREEYEKPVHPQGKYPLIKLFYYVAIKYKILETNGAGSRLEQGRNYVFFHETSVWERYALFLAVFLFDGTFTYQDGAWYTDRMTGLWDLYVDRVMEWAAAEKPWANGESKRLREDSGLFGESLNLLVTYMEELALVRVCGRSVPKDDMWKRWWEVEALPLLEIVSDIYENTEIETEKEDELSDSDESRLVEYFYKAYAGRFLQGEEEKLSGIFENAAEFDANQTIDLEVSVRYRDCVRVIRMNLEDSLYDLHYAIQRAVSFGDDHLFSFTVGAGMMKRTYVPSEARNQSSDLSVGTLLGELNLRKGQKFTYLFDFGDQWQFDIRVLGIQEGAVDAPEIIRAVGEAPEQYPCLEEDMELQVQVSDEVHVRDILASIEDDFIRDEHAALTGRKSPCEKEPADTLRREMERIVLENPDRMFLFMTAGMREMLSELLLMKWIDGSERCTLARLYSFGFCEFSGEYQDMVLVPEAIKEVYASRIKSGRKYDKIVEAAETFLEYCGVVEMEVLYAEVKGYLKKKIMYDDFALAVYSRLHYFGGFYSVLFQETEYMSSYDPEMTQRILEEREKPENAAFAYPGLEQICAEEQGGFRRGMRDWNEYVSFKLCMDWQMVERLERQIPALAASGVLKKEEVFGIYKELLRGTGCRATKKAESLIGELCSSMPLAVRRGNTGGEQPVGEKDAKQESGKAKAVREQKGRENEYTQLSFFDL
nr:hypothetical protein [uncultured Acetatifactor sp.]